MIEAALHVALAAVALAMLLATWRLVQGPDAPDRILAVDTLYVNTVALVILLGIRFDSAVAFEAALLVALIGFVATVALARFLFRGDVVE